MEFELGLTLEESSFIRNALDVVQIQGINARMVARLQDKFDEHLFQIQTNLQLIEQEKISQLEEITSTRGRKPKQ
jgi:hypothetical protein